MAASGSGSSLQEALQEVSKALAEHKAWENGYDTIFEFLRRAILHREKAGFDSEPCNETQIEDAWLFILQVRLRYKNRRKRVAECVRSLCSSARWVSVFRHSPRVRDALAELPDEAEDEILQIVFPDGPGEEGAGAATAAGNPWGVAAAGAGAGAGAGGVAASSDPWSSAGRAASGSPHDPWSSSGGARGAAAPNPWSGAAADPWAAIPAGGQKGAARRFPPAGDAFGGFPAAAPSGKGLPPAGGHTDDPFAAFPAAGGGGTAWPPAGQQDTQPANPKTKAGRQLFTAAYEAPSDNGGGATEERGFAQKAGAAVGEAGRKSVQAVREANERHDITGKVSHGAKVAANKTADASQQAFYAAKDFEHRHQIGTRTVDASKSALQAAKDANAKHDITGKIGRGASATASGISKGFSAMKEAATGGTSVPADTPAPRPQGSNPFDAPQSRPDALSSPPPGASPQRTPAPSPETRGASTGYNPFKQPVGQQSAGQSGQPAGGFMGQMDQRTQDMQQRVAQKAVNTAARNYTGGLVTNVPPGVSNAALDYAKRNPQDAAKFMHSAARMAT